MKFFTNHLTCISLLTTQSSTAPFSERKYLWLSFIAGGLPLCQLALIITVVNINSDPITYLTSVTIHKVLYTYQTPEISIPCPLPNPCIPYPQHHTASMLHPCQMFYNCAKRRPHSGNFLHLSLRSDRCS